MLRFLRHRYGVLAAAALSTACLLSTGPQLPRDTPTWLRDLIQDLASQPVANPPASITAFTYRDETVYFLPSRCCDIPSVLYDVNGVVLCAPDGGITGQGDGRCQDFMTARRDERLIWADPRGT
jgi:hypothetical protein